MMQSETTGTSEIDETFCRKSLQKS